MPIDLITLPPMRLAYMRNTGPYGDPAINQMWQRFAAWCAADGPMTARQTTYGISRDSPDITPPEKCRYDACTEVPDDFKPTGDIGVQQFDGGRYASMPFKGTTADIHGAWMRVFGEWLPQSGWQSDERPALERYGADLAMDCATGVFECELCVPVRPA